MNHTKIFNFLFLFILAFTAVSCRQAHINVYDDFEAPNLT